MNLLARRENDFPSELERAFPGAEALLRDVFGITAGHRCRRAAYDLTVGEKEVTLQLTDENYALETASQTMKRGLHLKYCTVISALNHSYWVLGVTVGALVVCLLGMAIDPDVIRARTNGMEFAMVALFLVIFTDQIRSFVSHEK